MLGLHRFDGIAQMLNWTKILADAGHCAEKMEWENTGRRECFASECPRNDDPLHRSRRSCALPLIPRSFGGLLTDCFLDFESRDGENPASVPMAAHPPSSTVRRCTCNTFLFLARRFLLSISERQQDRLLHAHKQMPRVREDVASEVQKKWLILRLPLELSA